MANGVEGKSEFRANVFEFDLSEIDLSGVGEAYDQVVGDHKDKVETGLWIIGGLAGLAIAKRFVDKYRGGRETGSSTVVRAGLSSTVPQRRHTLESRIEIGNDCLSVFNSSDDLGKEFRIQGFFTFLDGGKPHNQLGRNLFKDQRPDEADLFEMGMFEELRDLDAPDDLDQLLMEVGASARDNQGSTTAADREYHDFVESGDASDLASVGSDVINVINEAIEGNLENFNDNLNSTLSAMGRDDCFSLYYDLGRLFNIKLALINERYGSDFLSVLRNRMEENPGDDIHSVLARIGEGDVSGDVPQGFSEEFRQLRILSEAVQKLEQHLELMDHASPEL